MSLNENLAPPALLLVKKKKKKKKHSGPRIIPVPIPYPQNQKKKNLYRPVPSSPIPLNSEDTKKFQNSSHNFSATRRDGADGRAARLSGLGEGHARLG